MADAIPINWDDPVIKARTAKAVLDTIREVLADPEATDVERVELISDAIEFRTSGGFPSDPRYERVRDIVQGEDSGDVFVLFMRAQDVRDHYDGDEWATPILELAGDEEIEALVGEDALYDAWHDMCRDAVYSLREKYGAKE